MSLLARLGRGLLTVAVLGLLLYYLLMGTPPIIGEAPPSGPAVASNYLVAADNWQFDENGLRSHQLSVADMKFFDSAGVSIITEPRLALYTDGEPSWSVRADHGLLNDQEEHIRLSGEVVLRSLDGGPRLDTTEMDIYPRSKLAKSDQAVAVSDGSSQLTANTMEADLDKRRVTLKHKVEGSYRAGD